jgi:hypothetical protein
MAMVMVLPQQVARSLAASFLILLFIMYLIVLAIAGWALNRFLDQACESPCPFSPSLSHALLLPDFLPHLMAMLALLASFPTAIFVVILHSFQHRSCMVWMIQSSVSDFCPADSSAQCLCLIRFSLLGLWISVAASASVEYTFALLALIAGVVGMASVFAGCHHLHAWRGESGAAAASSAIIAWLLVLLAFG